MSQSNNDICIICKYGGRLIGISSIIFFLKFKVYATQLKIKL